MGHQHCVNKGEGYITSKTYQCYFRNVCVNILQLLLDRGVDYDIVLQHNIDFYQLPVSFLFIRYTVDPKKAKPAAIW